MYICVYIYIYIYYIFFRIFNSILWSSVSKAFEKSVNCFSLKGLEFRLESCKIACSDECAD